MRKLVAEYKLSAQDLIYPVFIQEGKNEVTEIKMLPGINRYTVDKLDSVCDELKRLGIPGLALFPVINSEKKDSSGTESLNENNVMCKAIKKIKKRYPELVVISDVALDPYTSHGHDGIIKNNDVENDETVKQLGEMAVLHARMGVDVVGPSDMMDGRVGYIRQELDRNGYTQLSILAYSAKYASAFYGPFRDALNSAPKGGGKESYQMSWQNKGEAIKEVMLDEEEGADIVMVKPALMYLDIIQMFKETTTLPVAAFHVSGEYAMLKFAQRHKIIEYDRALIETLTSIKRAGADIIVTYGAIDAAKIIKSDH